MSSAKRTIESPSLHDLAQTCQEISSLLESVHHGEHSVTVDQGNSSNNSVELHEAHCNAEPSNMSSEGNNNQRVITDQKKDGNNLLKPETQVIHNTDKLSHPSHANVDDALESSSLCPVEAVTTPQYHLEPVSEGDLREVVASVPIMSVMSADHAAAENDNNLNMLYASQAVNLVNAGNASVIVLQTCEGAENVVVSNLFAAQAAEENDMQQSSTDAKAELHAVELHVAEEPVASNSAQCDQSSDLDSSPVIKAPFGNAVNLDTNALQGELYIESASGPLLLHVVTDESEVVSYGEGSDIDAGVKSDSTTAGSSSVVNKLPALPGQDDKCQVERPFKCDLCSATFTRLGNYTRHRMIHTVKTKEDYRYKCEQCGRLFLQRCDHKRHLLIHNGTEPFRCEICNKGYIRRSDLTVHMRFHNKERSHQCGYCGKTFYQSGDLNRHIRQVHLRMKLLTCGHCQRRYSKESTLIHHMQTVHQDIILQSLGDKMADHVADMRVTLCAQNTEQLATSSTGSIGAVGQTSTVVVKEVSMATGETCEVARPNSLGSQNVAMTSNDAAQDKPMPRVNTLNDSTASTVSTNE